MPKHDLCSLCKISTLRDRHDCHLLLFMHKQKSNVALLKPKRVNTRLQNVPVFNTYEPNNEKARNNVLYKGAMKWNELATNDRNLDFKSFKNSQLKALKQK